MAGLLVLLLTITCFSKTIADQYYPPSGGGSGSGTVTSVTFTGDGTVLSSTPSSAVTTSGTLPATLASAAPYSFLANQTASAAAPTYGYGFLGQAATVTSGPITLTADSPSVQILLMTSGTKTVNLPQASTCPGKIFWFSNGEYSNPPTLSCYPGDTFLEAAASSLLMYPAANVGYIPTLVIIISTGSGWHQLLGPGIGNTSVISGGTATSGSNIMLGGTAGFSGLAVGAAGTVLGSTGSAPAYTLTPGSLGTLTSITATHQIAGGTAPTVAVGAGAGTGGSPAATITGHDTDFAVTLTMGTTTATGVIFTTTFGTAYASAPYVVITAANANAAAVSGTQGVYATSGTGTMVLNSGTVGLTATGAQYIWNVHCGQ